MEPRSANRLETSTRVGLRPFWQGLVLRMLQEMGLGLLAILLLVALFLPGGALERAVELTVRYLIPGLLLLMLLYLFLVLQATRPLQKYLQKIFASGRPKANELIQAMTRCANLPRKVFLRTVTLWLLGSTILGWMAHLFEGLQDSLPIITSTTTAMLSVSLLTYQRNKEALVGLFEHLASQLDENHPVPSWLGNDLRLRLQFVILILGMLLTMLGVSLLFLQIEQVSMLTGEVAGLSSFTYRATLGFGLTSLTLAALLGHLVSRELSGSIDPTVAHLRRLAKGDLSQNLPPLAVNEMERLAELLRRAVLQLRQQLEQITAQTGSLAEHVRIAERRLNQLGRNVEEKEEVLVQLHSQIGHGAKLFHAAEEQLQEVERLGEHQSANVMDLIRLLEGLSPWVQSIELSLGRVRSWSEESVQALEQQESRAEQILERENKSLERLSYLTEQLDQLEGSAAESTHLANRIRSSAKSGVSQLQSRQEGLTSIQESISLASQSIGSLGERSQEIASLLGVITSIAKQTNLLSLNASIIASQAGEHGRGFNMIADEIRSLAEKTGSYTEMVEELVGSIVQGTDQSIEAMMLCFERLSLEMESSRATGELLETIAQSSDEGERNHDRLQSLIKQGVEACGLLGQEQENKQRLTRELLRTFRDEFTRRQNLFEGLTSTLGALKNFSEKARQQQGRTSRSSRELSELRDRIQRIRRDLEELDQQFERQEEASTRLTGLSSRTLSLNVQMQNELEHIHQGTNSLLQLLRSFRLR